MLVVSAIEVGHPHIPALALVDSVEDSVDVLLGASGDALLLASADELSRASRITRAALDRPNIGLVHVDGTPTQRAAAVRFVSAIPVEAYGVAQELCDLVRRMSRTKLALSSVAGLTGATPSLGQHLRSWFPGASFDVDLTSGKVTSSKPVAWTPPPSALLCWQASESLSKLKVDLHGRPPGLMLPPSNERRFSAREWVELTALEDGGRMMGHLYATIRTRLCKGCARRVALSACPFCGSLSGIPQELVTSDRSVR